MDEADRRIKSDKLITVIALAVTAFVFIPVFIRRDIIFALNDDVMIRDILSGSYTGDTSCMTVYMRVPLSFVLSLLYRIQPFVPWFGAFQCGCFIASFFLILARIYGITFSRYRDRDDGKSRINLGVRIIVYSILCAVFFFCVIYPRFVLIHYTITAAVTGGTGLFLLITSAEPQENERKTLWADAAVMLILCDQIRSQVFIMILPFIFVSVLFLIMIKRKGVIRWFIVSALIYAALLGIHTACYAGGSWREYKDYNAARTELYDYALVWDTDDARAFYRQMGISDVEYPVLKNYDIALDEAADAELFRNMAAFSSGNDQKSFQVKLKETVWMIKHNIISKGTERSYALLLLSGYVLITVAIFIKKKYAFFIPAASGLILHFGLYGLLLWRGRFPERVMISLYFAEYLIIAALFVGLLRYGKTDRDEKIWCGTIILCAIMTVELTYIYRSADLIRVFDRTYDRQLSVNSDCNMLYLYLASEAKKDACYLTDIYTCVDATGNALSENCPQKGGACIPEMFTAGGWITGSPHMEKRQESFGPDPKRMYVCRENTGLSPEDFARFTGLYLTEIKRIETGYGTFVIYDGN
ncbi:MAG: hypothetical protein K6C99_03765 [Lachnospiraceae bacterium]|nr:hypothetical protein [Lachnospiraceae bacterium]